jgi:geranylgeranyl reductase family protein
VSERPSLHGDVVVVGAGPGGAAAAIELARAGRSVILADRATFPRDKCCGDGLTTLALRELEHLGFDPSSVPDWFAVDGAMLRSPSGREVRIDLPPDGTYAAVAPRRQLDHALVELARSAGVDVREGWTFGGIDTDTVAGRGGEVTTHFTRTTGGGVGENAQTLTVRSRYVVAADGMWSPVRKATDPPDTERYLGEWHGVRQYATGVTGRAASELFVWFEPDLLPGYAWSFPLPDGRANVGFGVLRRADVRGRDLKALWEGLVARPHIAAALGPSATLEERSQAWPIPARIDEVDLARCDGRVLFVGDAAGATDVMTGEGIGQALLTGRLAAEAIGAAGAVRPTDAGHRYADDVRHHLLADHRMSKLLGRALASDRGARGAIRVVAGSGTWGRTNFARWMFEDEPRAVVATPSRWHRRFLARPGAFR